ncbi:phytanoyl-CoA dioxygenase family protein [Sinorhizobium medicae]|uniref:phytanoyl-CoA dioxygenase family protein n=1 Tax=Sinorhizobium medicae TaxID=110321 RepID=UPI001295139A
MTLIEPPPTRQRLEDDGYLVVPRFLSDERVRLLDAIAAAARTSCAADHLGRDRYAGRVAEMAELPQLADVLCWPEHFELLKRLGFADPKWFMAFLLQKPPGGEALYWHQDWWGWRHHLSYNRAPPLMFMMFYLVDTTSDNGCLRVLPGSHVKPHPLHEVTALADYISYSSFDVPELFGRVEGEIDVPVSAGDLVIRDARLLHATHVNRSAQWRPMLSISVAGAYANLPSVIRRTMEIKRPKIEKTWPPSLWDQVKNDLSICPSAGTALKIDRVPNFRTPTHQ